MSTAPSFSAGIESDLGQNSVRVAAEFGPPENVAHYFRLILFLARDAETRATQTLPQSQALSSIRQACREALMTTFLEHSRPKF